MREKILSATAKILVKGGAEAPMSNIAKCAGVAVGSLYNHFSSKEELIRAVYERLAEEFAACVISDPKENIQASTRLERYIDSYIDFIWSDPDRAILFEYLSNLPLIPPAELLQHFAKSAGYIAAILRALQDAEHLRAGEPAQMAAFIGGSIRNTLKWRRVSGKTLTDQERENIRDMCLAAIRRNT